MRNVWEFFISLQIFYKSKIIPKQTFIFKKHTKGFQNTVTNNYRIHITLGANGLFIHQGKPHTEP